jgi:hypothetical protein
MAVDALFAPLVVSYDVGGEIHGASAKRRPVATCQAGDPQLLAGAHARPDSHVIARWVAAVVLVCIENTPTTGARRNSRGAHSQWHGSPICTAGSTQARTAQSVMATRPAPLHGRRAWEPPQWLACHHRWQRAACRSQDCVWDRDRSLAIITGSRPPPCIGGRLSFRTYSASRRRVLVDSVSRRMP